MAEQFQREATAVCDKLEPSDGVTRHRGALLTDLANTLAEQGKYAEARQAYQNGLKVKEELNEVYIHSAWK